MKFSRISSFPVIAIPALLAAGFLFFHASSAQAATLYYNAGTDNDWNTPGNWWTNPGFSSPAPGIPAASDDVIISANVNSNSGPAASVNTMRVNGANTDMGIYITVANGAIFNDTSTNRGGTVIGDLTFNNTSFNDSIVVGNPTFNDSSYNDFYAITGNPTFNGSSVNWGAITGNPTFNGSSRNGSVTVTGNATFNGSSYNYGGTIAGNATFTYAANGSITLTGNQTWGTVTGIAKDASGNPITAYIFDDSSSNNGTVAGSAAFNDFSRNGGTVAGDAAFNDSSRNDGSGTVTGNATFNDFSFSSGTVTGNATFTYLHALNGTVTLTGVQTWGTVTGIAKDASGNPITGYIFDDSSSNIGTVAGNAAFNDDSSNRGIVTRNVIFNDNSLNFSAIAGNPIFNDSSNNHAPITGNPIFNDSSSNGDTVVGNPTFNGSSGNSGAVTGGAIFNDSSSNNGAVTGNATFNGDLSENLGTVTGEKTRRYTANIATGRDFVTDGPWTVEADGATVNMFPAAYGVDPNSAAYTTLEPLNGGIIENIGYYESADTAVSPDSPGNEGTTDGLNGIIAPDANYLTTDLSQIADGYDSQVFRAKSNTPNIASPIFTVNWTGYGGTPSDELVHLSIWNFDASAWEELAAQNCPTDCALNGFKIGSRYRDANGLSWIRAQSDISPLNTDLLAFTVSSVSSIRGGGAPIAVPASVTLSIPNGGGSYASGTQLGIGWSSGNGAFVSYRVSYSSDNGNAWSVLTTVPNTSYTWTIPTASTAQGLIKVEGLNSAGTVLASAVSAATFTVNGTHDPMDIGAGQADTMPPPVVDSTVTGSYDRVTALANNPDINTDKGLTAVVSPLCVSGSLIKGTPPAVYYCGEDGKRYVFVNDKAYFSWYPDFSTVQTVSDATIASITIGGNVTYRPGTRMVKIQSDPRVYAVARGGVLRWVETEAAAARLYGANWNTTIDDVPDSFFVNYKIGDPITE